MQEVVSLHTNNHSSILRLSICMKNRTMFISSMARKNHERSKSTGTSINESYFAGHHDVAGKKKGSSSFDINGYENPCGVFVSGLQEQIRYAW